MLTFGGAFSNHILATAVAGELTGFKTIGIIRGDELGNNLEKTLASNFTLRHASKHGMQFKFVSREIYRNKTSSEFTEILQKEYGDFDSNAHIVAQFIKSVLEAVNKQKLKVPITIVAQLMIVLKLTRTVNDGEKEIMYKEDTHQDISGYNELLKYQMQQLERNNNGK